MILRYATNVARSTAYALPAIIKNRIPSVASLVEQVTDKTQREGTVSIVNEMRSVIKEDVFKLIHKGFDQAKNEWKTGKFYKTEEENLADAQEFLGIDDAAFDNSFLKGDSESGSESSGGTDQQATATAAAVGAAAGVRAAAATLGDSPAAKATAEASIATSRFSRANLSANIAVGNALRGAIVANAQILGRIHEFQIGPQQAYYRKQIEHNQAMAAMTSELINRIGELKKMSTVAAAASDQIMASIVGKESDFQNVFGRGGFSAEAYVKVMARKLKGAVGEGSTFSTKAKGIATGPLSHAFSMALESLIPKDFGKTLEQFNSFIGDLGILLNDRARNLASNLKQKGGFREFIGKAIDAFTIDDSSTSSGPNLSNIVRGKAVAFDGYAHRSIVEIIPGYLADIHSELVAARMANGHAGPTDRKMYNFDTGRFVSEQQTRKQIQREQMKRGDSPLDEIRQHLADGGDQKRAKSNMVALRALRDAGFTIQKGVPLQAQLESIAANMGPEGKEALQAAMPSILGFADKNGTKALSKLTVALRKSASAKSEHEDELVSKEGVHRGMFSGQLVRQRSSAERRRADAEIQLAMASSDPKVRQAAIKRQKELEAMGFGKSETSFELMGDLKKQGPAQAPHYRMMGASVGAPAPGVDDEDDDYIVTTGAGENMQKFSGSILRDEKGKVTVRSLLKAPMRAVQFAMDKFETKLSDIFFGNEEQGKLGLFGSIKQSLIGEVDPKTGLRSGGAFGGTIQKGKDYLSGLWTDTQDLVINPLKKYLFGEVGEDGRRSGGVVGGAIQKGKDWLTGLWTDTQDRVINPLKKYLFGAVGEDGKRSGGVVGSAIQKGKDFLTGLWTDTQDLVINPLKKYLFGTIGEDGKRTGGVINAAFQKGKNYLSGLWTDTQDFVLSPLKNALFGKAGADGKRSGGWIEKGKNYLTGLWTDTQDLVLKPLKKAIFGEEGEDGIRKGGVFGWLRSSFNSFFYGDDKTPGFVKRVIEPAKKFVMDEIWEPLKKNVDEMWEGAKKFFSDEIVAPLKGVIEPFVAEAKEQWRLMKEWVKGPALDMIKGVGAQINDVFKNNFGKGLSDMLKENVLNPIKDALGGVRKFLGDTLKSVFRFPVNILKGASDELAMSQIRRGTFKGSAAERERLIGKFKEDPSKLPEGQGSSIGKASPKAKVGGGISEKTDITAKAPSPTRKRKRKARKGDIYAPFRESVAAELAADGVSENHPQYKDIYEEHLAAAYQSNQEDKTRREKLAPLDAELARAQKARGIDSPAPGAVGTGGRATSPSPTGRGTVPGMGGTIGDVARAASSTADNTFNMYQFMTEHLWGVGKNVERIVDHFNIQDAATGGNTGDRKKSGGFLSKIRRALTNPIEFAREMFNGVFDFVKKQASRLFNAAKDVVMLPINAIGKSLTMLNKFVGGIREKFGEIAGVIKDTIVGAVKGAVELTSTIIKKAGEAIGSVVSSLAEAVPAVAKALTEATVGILKAGAQLALGAAQIAGELATTLVKVGGEMVKTAAKVTKDIVTGLARVTFDAIGSAFNLVTGRGRGGGLGKLTPVYVTGGYLAGTEGGAKSLTEAKAIGGTGGLLKRVGAGIGDLFSGGSETPDGGHKGGGFASVQAKLSSMTQAAKDWSWKKSMLSFTKKSGEHLSSIRTGFSRFGNLLIGILPMVAGAISGLVNYFKTGKFVTGMAGSFGKNGILGQAGGIFGGRNDDEATDIDVSDLDGGKQQAGKKLSTKQQNKMKKNAWKKSMASKGKFGKVGGVAKEAMSGLKGLGGKASGLLKGGSLLKGGLSLLKVGAGAGAGLGGMAINAAADKWMEEGGKKTAVKTAGSALEYGAIGAMVGSIIPGVGTAIGAGIGASAGVVVENWDSIVKGSAKLWDFTVKAGKAIYEASGWYGRTLKNVGQAVWSHYFGNDVEVDPKTGKVIRQEKSNMLGRAWESLFGSEQKQLADGQVAKEGGLGLFGNVKNVLLNEVSIFGKILSGDEWSIKDVYKNTVLDGVVERITNEVTNFGNQIRAIGESLRNGFNYIISFQWLSDIKNAVMSWWKGDANTQAKEAGTSWTERLGNRISDANAAAFKWRQGLGRDISGWAEGSKSKIDVVTVDSQGKKIGDGGQIFASALEGNAVTRAYGGPLGPNGTLVGELGPELLDGRGNVISGMSSPSLVRAAQSRSDSVSALLQAIALNTNYTAQYLQSINAKNGGEKAATVKKGEETFNPSNVVSEGIFSRVGKWVKSKFGGSVAVEEKGPNSAPMSIGSSAINIPVSGSGASSGAIAPVVRPQTSSVASSSSGEFAWPTDSKYVTSKFGPRGAPVEGASTQHNGIDIGIPVGTPIKAIADGKVTAVWDDKRYGGGYSVRIEHANGMASGYAHLSEQLVQPGQSVLKGDTIALSGGARGAPGAGKSSGPHLHFALFSRGSAIDPLPILNGEGIGSKPPSSSSQGSIAVSPSSNVSGFAVSSAVEEAARKSLTGQTSSSQSIASAAGGTSDRADVSGEVMQQMLQALVQIVGNTSRIADDTSRIGSDVGAQGKDGRTKIGSQESRPSIFTLEKTKQKGPPPMHPLMQQVLAGV